LASGGAPPATLGAGVCGLPSLLLARGGAHAVATDVPAVLPRLALNVDANVAGRRRRRRAAEGGGGAAGANSGAGAGAGAGGGGGSAELEIDGVEGGGSAAVLPLTWGDARDVAALRTFLRARGGGRAAAAPRLRPRARAACRTSCSARTSCTTRSSSSRCSRRCGC